MSGVVYQDLVPLPATTDPTEHEHATTMRDEPTLSHALAQEPPAIKGLAQRDTGAEVRDLGWNETKEKIPSPLVGGMANEELWLLLRRFNKASLR